jgi:hypothetical protein
MRSYKCFARRLLFALSENITARRKYLEAFHRPTQCALPQPKFSPFAKSPTSAGPALFRTWARKSRRRMMKDVSSSDRLNLTSLSMRPPEGITECTCSLERPNPRPPQTNRLDKLSSQGHPTARSCRREAALFSPKEF